MSGKDKKSTPKMSYFDRLKPLTFIDDRNKTFKKTTKQKSMEEIIHHQFTNYKRTLTNGNSIKEIISDISTINKKIETILREYTKKDDMISDLIKKNDTYIKKIFQLQERLYELEQKSANKQS